MNRERINLWVAKTVPLMIEIGTMVGASPFPGRDAEIELIEMWVDEVAARIEAGIDDNKRSLITDIESLQSYNFFSEGSFRSEVAKTPNDGVYVARADVVRIIRSIPEKTRTMASEGISEDDLADSVRAMREIENDRNSGGSR